MYRGRSLMDERLRHRWRFAAVFLGTLLGIPLAASADNECLVSVHDSNDAPITEGASVCQNAVGKSCTFDLQACVNDEVGDCSPGVSKSKKIHATGHCGAIGKLQVDAAPDSRCGGTASIRVHTKKNGKRPGNCNLRISVHTKDGRQDVDKLTLLCNPESGPQCPEGSTTT